MTDQAASPEPMWNVQHVYDEENMQKYVFLTKYLVCKGKLPQFASVLKTGTFDFAIFNSQQFLQE